MWANHPSMYFQPNGQPRRQMLPEHANLRSKAAGEASFCPLATRTPQAIIRGEPTMRQSLQADGTTRSVPSIRQARKSEHCKVGGAYLSTAASFSVSPMWRRARWCGTANFGDTTRGVKNFTRAAGRTAGGRRPPASAMPLHYHPVGSIHPSIGSAAFQHRFFETSKSRLFVLVSERQSRRLVACGRQRPPCPSHSSRGKFFLFFLSVLWKSQYLVSQGWKIELFHENPIFSVLSITPFLFEWHRLEYLGTESCSKNKCIVSGRYFRYSSMFYK